MVRTQVYLQDDQYQRIMTLAKTSGRPMAVIIRLAIKKGLAFKEENNLFDLAKLKITGGPKNLSGKLDDYLYGS